MSFARDRERRTTAGKRMTDLVGEALENDNTFWSHDTWADDEDNESFRESDEDSANRKDEFDSDFDDSESDNEGEEVATGAAEEEELLQAEKRSNRKQQKSYVDLATKGRKALLKKKKPGKKIVTGEGMNAGIVLNIPPPPPPVLVASTGDESASAAATASTALPMAPLPPPIEQQNSASLPSHPQSTETIPATSATIQAPPPAGDGESQHNDHHHQHHNHHHHSSKGSKLTIAAARPRRSATKLNKYTSRFRTARNDAVAAITASSPSAKQQTSPTSSSHHHHISAAAAAAQRQRRRLYKQEELILEAANETEPENQRWILARKRYQDQSTNETNNKHSRSAHEGGKVIEKFTSRRGYLNILTFPEMDHVPEILTRRRTQNSLPSSVTAAAAATTTDNSVETNSHVDGASTSSAAAASLVDSSTCVVSGKRARYRDPLTRMPYHDAAAFKELRKRHEAGEPLVSAVSIEKATSGAVGTARIKQVPSADPILSAEPAPASSFVAVIAATKPSTHDGKKTYAGVSSAPETKRSAASKKASATTKSKSKTHATTYSTSHNATAATAAHTTIPTTTHTSTSTSQPNSFKQSSKKAAAPAEIAVSIVAAAAISNTQATVAPNPAADSASSSQLPPSQLTPAKVSSSPSLLSSFQPSEAAGINCTEKQTLPNTSTESSDARQSSLSPPNIPDSSKLANKQKPKAKPKPKAKTATAKPKKSSKRTPTSTSSTTPLTAAKVATTTASILPAAGVEGAALRGGFATNTEKDNSKKSSNKSAQVESIPHATHRQPLPSSDSLETDNTKAAVEGSTKDTFGHKSTSNGAHSTSHVFFVNKSVRDSDHSSIISGNTAGVHASNNARGVVETSLSKSYKAQCQAAVTPASPPDGAVIISSQSTPSRRKLSEEYENQPQPASISSNLISKLPAKRKLAQKKNSSTNVSSDQAAKPELAAGSEPGNGSREGSDKSEELLKQKAKKAKKSPLLGNAPPSPSRKSPRRRIPSAKMIENLELSDKLVLPPAYFPDEVSKKDKVAAAVGALAAASVPTPESVVGPAARHGSDVTALPPNSSVEGSG